MQCTLRPHRRLMTAVPVVWLLTFGLALDGQQEEARLLIRGGTVFTLAGDTIAPGDVLIENGKISAVGARIQPPPGSRVVNASGHFVMPGIVDPHTHFGGAGPAPADNPVTPGFRIIDRFKPDDPFMKRAVSAGITTTLVLPGSSNVIGGEGFILKLRIGKTASEMKLEGAPRTLKMAMGENPVTTYGLRGNMPTTRMGVAAILREAFSRAADYRAMWDEWSKGSRSRGEPPVRDEKLEVLADVLRGQVDVHIHCYRRDEFLTAMRIADEIGFRIQAFHHATEAYRVYGDLKRRGIAAAVYPDSFGRKIEHWNHVPQNAAFLLKEGVLTSLHSDLTFFSQRMFTEAAKLLKYGHITEDEALKAITLYPARILRLDKRVGTLEPGKDGDVVILTRHPFDSFTRVVYTIIDGAVVFDSNRDADWYDAH